MNSRQQQDSSETKNAILMLLKDQKRLDAEKSAKKKQIAAEKERLERLSSQLQLSKQQVELFTQEAQMATEGIKDTIFQFTKELCGELSRLKTPSQTMIEVAEKFMYVLDQKDRSWKAFRTIAKNYGPLKAWMSNINPDSISEDTMSELLSIWKNRTGISQKLAKYRGAVIITTWLSLIVEYKLKKETIVASKKKLPDLERKIKAQFGIIAETNSRLQEIEEEIRGIDKSVTLIENDYADCDGQEEEELSVNVPKNSNLIENTPGRQSQTTPRFPEFRDFQQDEITYVEHKKSHVQNSEPSQSDIIIESEHELLSCCGNKFFCF